MHWPKVSASNCAGFGIFNVVRERPESAATRVPAQRSRFLQAKLSALSPEKNFSNCSSVASHTTVSAHAASTTAVGARLAFNFEHNRPTYIDDLWVAILSIAHPSSLLHGLPFSLTLFTILLAHEMGHYLTCRYYRIDASLPYFLPAPTLIGTFGAFIRIRSAIPTEAATLRCWHRRVRLPGFRFCHPCPGDRARLLEDHPGNRGAR